jgi:hypothetical protein
MDPLCVLIAAEPTKNQRCPSPTAVRWELQRRHRFQCPVVHLIYLLIFFFGAKFIKNLKPNGEYYQYQSRHHLLGENSNSFRMNDTKVWKSYKSCIRNTVRNTYNLMLNFCVMCYLFKWQKIYSRHHETRREKKIILSISSRQKSK